MAMNPSPIPAKALDNGSYVEWSTIFAGAIVTIAVSFVLFTFGSGVGLSMVSPEPGEGVSMRWFTIAAGIWFVWVAISSFAAGGYLAGRLRRRTGDGNHDEVETRDGAHGVVVWAAATLIASIMAASGVSGLIGGTASAVGGAASTITETMQDEVDYYAGLALRGDTGTVVDNPEARAEIGRILMRSVSEGEIAQGDRTYLAQVVAAQTNVDQAQAEAKIDQVVTEFNAARDQALEAIDQARKAGVIGAFTIAATLLIGAACAYFAAVYGGSHRDQNTAFSTFGRNRL
jgi:hypothetical protein